MNLQTYSAFVELAYLPHNQTALIQRCNRNAVSHITESLNSVSMQNYNLNSILSANFTCISAHFITVIGSKFICI